jgi:hypothetical protein
MYVVRVVQGPGPCRIKAIGQGLAAWKQAPGPWSVIAGEVARLLEHDPDLAQGAGGSLMTAVRKLLTESPGPDGNLLPLGERPWTAKFLAEDPLLRAIFGESKTMPSIFLPQGETDPDTGFFQPYSLSPDLEEGDYWLRVTRGKNRGGVELGLSCETLVEDYEGVNGGKAPFLGKGGLHPRLRCMAARICEVLATAPLSRVALETLPDRKMGILAMARIPILNAEAHRALVPPEETRTHASCYENLLRGILSFLADSCTASKNPEWAPVMRMMEEEGAATAREVALHFLRWHPASVGASYWEKPYRGDLKYFKHVRDSLDHFLEILRRGPLKFGNDSPTDLLIAFHRDFCRGISEWASSRPEELGKISCTILSDSWRIQAILRQVCKAPGIKPSSNWADPLMETLRQFDEVKLEYFEDLPGIRTHGCVGDVLAEWTGYLRNNDWEQAFQPRNGAHFPPAWYAAKSGLAMDRMATEDIFRIVAFNTATAQGEAVPIPLLQGFLTAEIQRQVKKDLLVAVSREFLERAEENIFAMEKLTTAAKGPDGKSSAYTGAELLGIACGCGYPALTRALAEQGVKHPECWHLSGMTAQGRKVSLLDSLLAGVRFNYHYSAKPAGGPAEGARVLFCYLKKAEEIRDLKAIATIRKTARQIKYDPLFKEAEGVLQRCRTSRALETGGTDRDEPIL